MARWRDGASGGKEHRTGIVTSTVGPGTLGLPTRGRGSVHGPGPALSDSGRNRSALGAGAGESGLSLEGSDGAVAVVGVVSTGRTLQPWPSSSDVEHQTAGAGAGAGDADQDGVVGSAFIGREDTIAVVDFSVEDI